MEFYKTKIGRTINFIKNEGKFNRSDYVKVVKNTSGFRIYDKYIGQKAIVTNVHFDKKNYIVGLKFLNGQNIDFKVCELEKCDYKEMYTEEYRKLLHMI